MKESKDGIKIKGIGNNFIRTCPVCGFTFRILDPKTKKKITVCPMCGYKFVDPDLKPYDKDKVKKRFF